jgi:signal transduction histidine kinase
MLPRYENRVQLALALLVGVLLLANLFTLTLVALTPATRAARAPVLLAVFVVTLIISVPCILLLPRWLLRPYRQLVDEAKRAPIGINRHESRDETEFVLETFQGVVEKLRAQQRELENLNARVSARALTAEQFSERIVASVPSGLVAFDRSGHATMVNAPARALLASDGEKEHYEKLLRASPDLAAIVKSCLLSGELYRREEVFAKDAAGRVRRLGVTVAPIDPQSGGSAGGALCLLTDITEVVELRETVALKRNLESLGEMSAGLAHEFKNSLATLHGYAQLLGSVDLHDGERGIASALLAEVRGLSEMVTTFLNFARPQPLIPDNVCLHELLQDCLTELQPLFEERRVSVEIKGEFPQIQADERMLRPALLNILRNAAEAIDEQKQERLVKVYGAHDSDAAGKAWASVEISDTGDGIAPEDMRRIFIPFFTTKSKGHGIGLALAHRVITEHGGTLAASDAPHGGALFIIRLPVETESLS